MRLIIEARLVDGDSDTVEAGDGVLAMVERADSSLAELGLTLAEGRSLPASQGPADQQQHRRVRGEPGCRLPYGQEATDALD
jgi:hypothetical protein